MTIMRCRWNFLVSCCPIAECPERSPWGCIGWDTQEDRQVFPHRSAAASNEAIAGRTAAYAESLNVSRETIPQPPSESTMNRRPESIADVRQNCDEREPIAILRATDPYAVELLDVYSHLLLGDGATAIEHWEELWRASVRERASSDEGDLRTRGGMAHELTDKMREFRDRGPQWRIMETHVMRDGTVGKDNPLGQIEIFVMLRDERSGRRTVRCNRRNFDSVLQAVDYIYGTPPMMAPIAHTIATTDDWYDPATEANPKE